MTDALKIRRKIYTRAANATWRGALWCKKPMAIYRLIANGSFGPDEIDAMTAAYEGALLDLRLTDRDDPVTELIANAIISVTGTGERDPVRIKERALNALGVHRLTAA